MSASRKPQSRGPHQLPPGRHGLTRQFVASNQRERILDAVADVVSFAGYAAMSGEEIIATAGVSRRTFYDNFKSKEDAFLTAYNAVGAELSERVQAAYGASESFAARPVWVTTWITSSLTPKAPRKKPDSLFLKD